MKTRNFLAAALLAGLASGPAVAQQAPIQLILNFDGAQFGETLTAMGATWQKRANDQGAPFYSIKFSNGANALAVPSVCNGEQPNTGCTGMRLWATFTKPQQLTPGAVAQRVNQYNIGHLATMASYSDNGNATLNMYLIADSGIAIANLRIKLQVFETSAGSFSRALYN
jgi:hypothetical protein